VAIKLKQLFYECRSWEVMQMTPFVIIKLHHL